MIAGRTEHFIEADFGERVERNLELMSDFWLALQQCDVQISEN
jgi:hypothetical protein